MVSRFLFLILLFICLKALAFTETVEMVQVTPEIKLQTTIFKPNGTGPFPLLVMNHGKDLDIKDQPRSRSWVVTREFLKRGYAVVVPMRRGFSLSTGPFQDAGCDLIESGRLQAEDIKYTLDYFVKQPWVIKNEIVVGGQSYGGLATLAFGELNYPGVRALINFAGGLKFFSGCPDWEAELVRAVTAYGTSSRAPSIWFYGANDSHFSQDLAVRMFTGYDQHHLTRSSLILFGSFRDDAHSMTAYGEGVKIWWPRVSQLLMSVGLPTSIKFHVNELASTEFAPLGNVEAVPHLDKAGRKAYQEYLLRSNPKAFVISSTGNWSWASDGDDPIGTALQHCREISRTSCKVYAEDDEVVYQE